MSVYLENIFSPCVAPLSASVTSCTFEAELGRHGCSFTRASFLSVSESRLEWTAVEESLLTLGVLVYFTRSTAALWRLTDPAPPRRTLSLFNNDFYALLSSMAAPATLANQLLHIWSVRCFPLFSYPDVHYPPAGVYNHEIGAWVTSRQLIGNGP